MITIIAAHNLQRVIGNNGAIPWHLPEDLKRFKELTIGNTVLMGRRTYDTIGAPLAERRNLIISRTLTTMTGAEVFPSIDSAIASCTPNEHLFIIGGGEIYAQTLSTADELKLTVVRSMEEGNVLFPEYASLIGTKFRLTAEVECEGFSFKDYQRM